MPAGPRPAGRTWRVLATLALVVAAGCALAELVAGPGYRNGWWSLGAGLTTMRSAAWTASGAVVVALVVAALAARSGQRASARWAVLAALIGLAAAVPPGLLWMKVQQLPRIHDISTDTSDPPRFVAVIPRRTGARNPVDYDPAVAALQQRGYPDLASVDLAEAPAAVFERAERIARGLGWEIVDADRSALRIEATDTTRLFGFKDDVVIRIVARDGGSRVDLRSLSRVGGSDFGTNAARIRAFSQRLRDGRSD